MWQRQSHRRVRKIVRRYDDSGWQPHETHTFVWDDMNIVLERIAFADGTTRTVEYFWGNDLSGTEQGAGGVGGLVAVSVDGAFFIPCYDHNGNIVCYVSESGTIAAQYVYDPYGNVVEQYGTLADRFAIRFSTKYTDVETGLISYLRRFYRPDHGRWLNRDPIEERGGENLYSFGLNNPILKVDVYGLYTLSDAERSLRLRSVRPTAGLNSIMPFYDDETLFNEWIALERTRGSWWSSLPKCPGRLCLKNGRPVNPDSSKWKNPERGGQILSRYHPGGVFEMRSLAVEGHGNQCVYDADGKVLVGPPSGGTVDWAAPGLSYLWGHGPHDVNTYELAERIKRIPDYYSVRPSW